MSTEDERARIEQECDDFCSANWTSIAAAAWRHFQNHGRGALLLEFASIEHWKAGEAFNLEPLYVTTWNSDDCELLLLRYDPETQVLVAFSDDPDAVKAKPSTLKPFAVGSRLLVRIYTGHGSSTPPEAHRQTFN